MTTTYNGWENRQTWCLNLWMTNIEHVYRMWDYRAEKIVNAIDMSEQDFSVVSRQAVEELAEDMKSWFDDIVADGLTKSWQASILADLIPDDIYWEAIAEGFLEDHLDELRKHHLQPAP